MHNQTYICLFSFKHVLAWPVMTFPRWLMSPNMVLNLFLVNSEILAIRLDECWTRHFQTGLNKVFFLILDSYNGGTHHNSYSLRNENVRQPE